MNTSHNRSFLVLMVLAVMLLFFALSSAVCVQAFVRSYKQSEENSRRDSAAFAAQSMAEAGKAAKGESKKVSDMLSAEETQNGAVLYYDKNWAKTTAENAVYTVCGSKGKTDTKHLASYNVSVKDRENNVIFELDTAFQED